jgi:putative membrane protein
VTSPDQAGGREPDYRMSLAAERTFLAYVRTALALLAGGVAIVGALPDAGQVGLRRAVGAVLVLLGLVVAANARRRWRLVDAAMRHGEPLPHNVVATAVGYGVVAAAVLAFVLVLLL